MNRCRRTDAIADIVADPALGADALTEEQRRHVSVCADCFQVVADLERLDAALTAGLRSRPREELPISILAAPALPRSSREGPSPMAFLAAAAVVVLAIGLTLAGARWLDLRQIGIGPTDPSTSPQPTPAPSATAAPSLAPAPSSTPAPSATPASEPVSLEVGAIAAVVDEPLVVRVAPGTDPDTTMTDERLWIGQRVRILDGPARSDGYTWWEVQVGEIRGWVADAERDGSKPWLSPIANGQIAYADAFPETRILVASPEGGAGSVLVDLGETAEMRLVISCAGGALPTAWSHDGARLLFAFAIGGCDQTVGIVGADGSGLRLFDAGHTPAWRPDGGMVAYGQNMPFQPCGRGCGGSEDDGPWEILGASPDGEPTPLTQNDPWTSASQPTWSPDRRTLAFSRFEVPAAGDLTGGMSDIYVSAGDGSASTLLVLDGQDPIWSPDGRWVYFNRHDPDSGEVALHRVRPDGSHEEIVAEGVGTLRFSPDGTRIAFVREGGLFIMAPDGSEVAGLIPGRTVDGFDWSPDGRHLVAAIDYAGNHGLYRVTLDGEAPAIWGLGIDGYLPVWQPVLLDPRLAD